MFSQTHIALFLAIVLHVLIAMIVWVGWDTSHHLKIDPTKEQRFGISLSETLLDSPKSLSSFEKMPLASNDLQPLRQTISNRQPSQNPLVEPVPTDLEKPAFTEADRERLPFSIIHHYGETFFSLSAGEQHYIIDNLQRIRKINEVVGTALLAERLDDIDPLDSNIVTFILHPDGTISDLELDKNRIGTPLDELTVQTINLAHTRYPKPQQPTRIRIKVYIVQI